MARAVTKAELEAYRARWHEVNEFQTEELRKTTFRERWKQLNALIRLARGLGWPLTQNDEEVAMVRSRWQKLKGLN